MGERARVHLQYIRPGELRSFGQKQQHNAQDPSLPVPSLPPRVAQMLQYAKENRARRERGKPKMGRTDLRYWPEHTQHIVASEQIVQLGHLAQGFPDVAVVDGPLGTNMVALPGRISPTEFDPKRYSQWFHHVKLWKGIVLTC